MSSGWEDLQSIRFAQRRDINRALSKQVLYKFCISNRKRTSIHWELRKIQLGTWKNDVLVGRIVGLTVDLIYTVDVYLDISGLSDGRRPDCARYKH